MFGHNLKDAMGLPLYKELTYDELENLAKGMIAYAKSQPPFDSVAAAKKAQETPEKGVYVEPTTEQGVMRIRGSKSLAACNDYNKFIRLGLHALQLSYWEMEVPDMGRVAQLTVVDNYGFPLEKELVHGFVDLFLDYRGKPWHQMETPPHVGLVVQYLNPPEATDDSSTKHGNEG